MRTQVYGGRRQQVEIRPACGGDRDAVRDFLAGLSPATRYQRFFTGAPPTAALLSLLTGARENTDVIIASGQTDPARLMDLSGADDRVGPAEHPTIIGHAMAVDTAGPEGIHRIEIGVVVADSRQGQGVGSALVRVLVDRARARGVHTIEMEVLAENRRALAMIARHWPHARYEPQAAYVAVRTVLPQHEEERPDAASASPGPATTRPGSPGPGSPASAAALRAGREHMAPAGARRRRPRHATSDV